MATQPVRNGTTPLDFDALPGGDLVRQGIADLVHDRRTAEALLVLVGGPRLTLLGFTLAAPSWSTEHPERQLWELLARGDPDSAHGRYNALVRRLVSFERAAPCAAP